MAHSLLNSTALAVKESEFSWKVNLVSYKNKSSDFINTQKTPLPPMTEDMKLQTIKWSTASMCRMILDSKNNCFRSRAKSHKQKMLTLNHEQYHDQPLLFRIEHISLTTFANYFNDVTYETLRIYDNPRYNSKP